MGSDARSWHAPVDSNGGKNVADARLLGSRGEFVGAIALVLNPGYLATRIRHNTAAVKNEAEQESSQFWYELNVEVDIARPFDSQHE